MVRATWLDNDDDLDVVQRNWRNSSVMQTFAEMLDEDPDLAAALERTSPKDDHKPLTLDEFMAETDKASEGPLGADDEPAIEGDDLLSADEASNRLLTAGRRAEVATMITRLGSLIEESKRYSNEKATYVIERAQDELRAILED